jgi:hypothetical protein
LSALAPYAKAEGKMPGDDSGNFFCFILGASMAAVLCGAMLFATGNFVANSTNMKIASIKIESPIVSTEK